MRLSSKDKIGVYYLNLRSWIIILILGFIASYVVITTAHENRQRQLVLNCCAHSIKYAQKFLANYGPLEVRGDLMFAGKKPLNGAYEIVDSISSETGFGASIFLGNMRIATNAREENSEVRAIGTASSYDIEIITYQKGQTYLGVTRSLGQNWIASYVPLKNQENKIVGMMSLFTNEEDFLSDINAFNILLLTFLLFLFGILCYVLISIDRKRKSLAERNEMMQHISGSLNSAMKETEKNEAKYRSIFENTFDLIQAVDASGRFL